MHEKRHRVRKLEPCFYSSTPVLATPMCICQLVQLSFIRPGKSMNRDLLVRDYRPGIA